MLDKRPSNNILIWRCGLTPDVSFTVNALRLRIPTDTELVKRWVNIDTLICQMCDEKEESVDHVLVDCSYAKMVLEGIMRWCKGLEEIKDEVFRFFQDKFLYAHVYRPKLINPMFRTISMMDAIRIKSSFNLEEVTSAYVDGRCILDGPLMINEVCSWAKRAHKKILLFKADFDKAFDSVNWQYLDSILEQMGFGNKWRMWIRGCLNSSRASVIINGSPTREFPISRRVRQGDPLSPYLFIIAMEGLSVALKSACDKGLFNGVQISGNGPILSHIFYADDALFIGEWSRTNLKNLARILRCFHISSGLKVNFHKSKGFGIGVNPSETVNWANLLGCVSGDLPFDYLGVPVGANMNLIKYWKPIIKKFHSKLSLWKAKTLSFGGRLTLINSVLGNLPTYYLSLFRAPLGVLEELEKIRHTFLWGGCDERKKIHWVSWEKVLAAKEDGGLGVGSIQALDIVLLMKWWWRLNNETHSLWARVIYGIHNLSNKPFEYLSKQRYSGVWNNIVGTKKVLCDHGLEVYDIFNVKIAPGNKTLFWYDNWLGSGSLKTKYPALFELETKKRCIVSDRIGGLNQTWTWKSRPTNRGLESDVNALISEVSDIRLDLGMDHWRCKLSSDGMFFVCSIRQLIDKLQVSIPVTPVIVWSKAVPIKVLCFIWRVAQSRIPSAVALERRGIIVNSTLCSSCIGRLECADHVLIDCLFTTQIRNCIWSWCGVSSEQASLKTISDLIHFASTWDSQVKRKRFVVICYGLLWNLWRFRNKRLFQMEGTSVHNGIECIKSMVFYWLKHRGNNGICSWEEWFISPFSGL
uniref:Reverse transcriptase domain-containing protein n=1 Tax=Lactuca sativa TaxID=4236 RepID=A0A9R1W8E6_LACSA|nr:hypothetical protein LSAT_V11C300139740 [Lactuca sativa]